MAETLRAGGSAAIATFSSPRWGAWLLVGMLAVASGARAGEPPARLADPRLLTIIKGEVHVFRERSLEHLGTVNLPRGWAQSWWLDAGAGRLGVLSKEGLLRQKGPLQLTIVDLAAPKVVASVAVPGTVQFLIRTDSGRLGYLSLFPQDAKKGQDAARLVRVDLESGAITGERPLVAAPSAMVLSSDEQEVVLIFAGSSGKTRAERRPGRIQVLAADSLEPRAELELPGPADGIFWNGDRTRLYAEDAGIDSARPEVALPGHIFVIDPKRAALLADLDVGIGPGPLGWDGERGVFYFLTRPRKAKDAAASLQLLRGETIEGEIGLPKQPLAVVPNADRSRFYVLEDKGITIVDGDLAAVQGHIALGDSPTGVLPLESANRAFVTFGGSSQVAAVDLTTRQVLAHFTTGRTGKKIGLFAAAVLGTALSQANSLMLTGNQYALAQVVTYPSPETSGLLSPDGKLAFFFNTQTGDYTVIDVAANRLLDKVAGGGLQFLPDGKTAVVMQVTDVVLWDLEQHRTLTEIDAGGGGKVLCPDGDHVWALAGMRNLNVVDLAKRAVAKKFDGLGGSFLFYDAGTPPPAATPQP
jgi:DNA-binding beta-propeller fold protein YncE